MNNAPRLYKAIMADNVALNSVLQAANVDVRKQVVLDLGQRLGFPVSVAEAESFMRSLVEGELSDEDLELIVGGKGGDSGKPKGKHLKGDNFWDFGWMTGNYDDRLVGDSGDDTIEGKKGEDRLYGQAGHDKIYGGDGHDTIEGGLGNDQIRGDSGNDLIKGGYGNDKIEGGSGNDLLYGGYGSDTIWGGDGDDFISGEDGNDCLIGGDGNDRIIGGEGGDTIEGGAGDDRISGGRGFGSDIIVYGQNDGNDTILEFEVGRDKLLLKGATFDDFDVAYDSGDIIITFGNTTITLEDKGGYSKQSIWDRMVITEMPK